MEKLRYYDITGVMREAGKIILSAHDRESDSNFHVKPGTSNFVTEFDVASQTYLETHIRELYPEVEFIAEEQVNDLSALSGDMCVIIDPIDGTTNFVHDCRMSCISVGVISHGVTVFGAVYNPYRDELFCAEKGKGAYLNGKPIRVSDRLPERAVCTFGTSPYYKNELSERTFRMAHEVFRHVADMHRTGSAAIDLCDFAAGRIDMFFEFILQQWDIAAGILIIEEAGGKITDFEGNEIKLDKPSPVIAGNVHTYPVLKEIAGHYDTSL